jgi:hypothetical protein
MAEIRTYKRKENGETVEYADIFFSKEELEKALKQQNIEARIPDYPDICLTVKIAPY